MVTLRSHSALLGQLKTNIDSGIFQAVQWAALAALESVPGASENDIYEARQARAVNVLGELGWNDIVVPDATFYLWLPVPPGHTSIGFAKKVLEEAAVSITPGVGFWSRWGAHFRLSLTVPDARLDAALERLRGLRF